MQEEKKCCACLKWDGNGATGERKEEGKEEKELWFALVVCVYVCVKCGMRRCMSV